MKVLIVPSWYPTELSSLSGVFFEEQALALQKNDLNVIVAYPEIRSLRKYKSYKTKSGFQIEYKNKMKIYRKIGYNYLPGYSDHVRRQYLKWLEAIFEEILKNEGKPDIIHAHSIVNGGWAAAKIAQKYDIPLVITEHSSIFTRDLIKNSQKKHVVEALEIADEIMVVGSSLKIEIEKYTKKEVNIIPNIVDMEMFKPKEILSINKKFRFFSLAFLNENKGMDILLKAFQAAFKDNDNVELIIGGEGQEKEKLMKQSKELEIHENVHFLGGLNRSEVVRQMHECDSFVLASRSETFGVVYIEALAAGKPIIATKSGGPNTIVNEKNGLLVNVGSIEELSLAMCQMVENYERYNANEIIEDCYVRFSEEAVCGKLITVYKRLIKL